MDERDPTIDKNRLRPEDGIIHAAEDVDRINDQSPTEDAGQDRHETDVPLDKRPTDGPL